MAHRCSRSGRITLRAAIHRAAPPLNLVGKGFRATALTALVRVRTRCIPAFRERRATGGTRRRAGWRSRTARRRLAADHLHPSLGAAASRNGTEAGGVASCRPGRRGADGRAPCGWNTGIRGRPKPVVTFARRSWRTWPRPPYRPGRVGTPPPSLLWRSRRALALHPRSVREYPGSRVIGAEGASTVTPPSWTSPCGFRNEGKAERHATRRGHGHGRLGGWPDYHRARTQCGGVDGFGLDTGMLRLIRTLIERSRCDGMISGSESILVWSRHPVAVTEARDAGEVSELPCIVF